MAVEKVAIQIRANQKKIVQKREDGEVKAIRSKLKNAKDVIEKMTHERDN